MTDLIDVFDVLIVYSSKIATSAADVEDDNEYPFPITSWRSHYNNAYAYLLEMCAKHNIHAAFTTSADVVGAGLCQSYWLYKEQCWIKMQNRCSAKVIFDKVKPANAYQKRKRKRLFSDVNVQAFNDPYLYRLFADKLETFQTFSKKAIPTVEIFEKDIKSIRSAVVSLKKLVDAHDQSVDFDQGVILKNRYGASGFKIFKIDSDIAKNIQQIMRENGKTVFVIQPFALFDKGFVYKDLKGAFDIRLIFMGKEIFQSYIRKAAAGDFRCNEHQGGTITYVELQDISENVLQLAYLIANQLNKPNSLYALDFIVSNQGNVYFLEGNSGPGIDWNLLLSEQEKKSKELINTIVGELHNRVRAVTS